MSFDRWAIVEGWYWYCSYYHNGQNSRLYKRLCKMQMYYRPSTVRCAPTPGPAEDVYLELVRKHEAQSHKDNL